MTPDAPLYHAHVSLELCWTVLTPLAFCLCCVGFVCSFGKQWRKPFSLTYELNMASLMFCVNPYNHEKRDRHAPSTTPYVKKGNIQKALTFLAYRCSGTVLSSARQNYIVRIQLK